jgi:hypothetical protein
MIDRFSQEPFDRKALNRKMKNDFESEVHQAIARLSVDLFRLASHCKHHGYFEEHEWRLALPHSKARPLIFSKVEYREPTRIPYIAHRISGQPKLPILRVLAGFACYELERIETALAVNGYSVRVSKSELPEMR